jgi:hypothetical protein
MQQLAYDDFQNMHILRRTPGTDAGVPKTRFNQHGEVVSDEPTSGVSVNRQRVVPLWAMNDVDVKTVVLEKLRRFCRNSTGVKTQSLTDRAALDVAAREATERLGTHILNEKLSESQRTIMESRIADSERSRSAILVNIVYFSYRLGWNSVAVAEKLKLSPVAVRQHLHRLNVVAKDLMPEKSVLGRVRRGPQQAAYLDMKIALLRLQLLRVRTHVRNAVRDFRGRDSANLWIARDHRLHSLWAQLNYFETERKNFDGAQPVQKAEPKCISESMAKAKSPRKKRTRGRVTQNGPGVRTVQSISARSSEFIFQGSATRIIL